MSPCGEFAHTSPVPICVVIYLDRGYAIPATVMVRSLLEHSRTAKIKLFVLGIELDSDTKQTMLASWPSERVQARFVDVDWRRYRHIFTPVTYVSGAAYLRLLIDRLLPPDIEKVITLDCDGVMLADVAELWQLEPADCVVRAVKDPCVPRLRDDHSPFVVDDSEAGIPYFNSGVMLIDLKRWRAQEISRRCIELAERYVGQALFPDQTLLNTVLRGRWEALPLRWNCNATHLAMHAYPSLRNRVYSYAEIVAAIRAPAFVHFISARKPWQRTPYHPHRDLYEDVLARTAWNPASSPANRFRSAIAKTAYPWRCYQRAHESTRKLGLPPMRFANSRHLLRTFLEAPGWRSHGRMPMEALSAPPA